MLLYAEAGHGDTAEQLARALGRTVEDVVQAAEDHLIRIGPRASP